MPRIIKIIGEFRWAKIPFTKPKQANLPAKFHLEIFIINFHSTWLLYFYNRPKIPIVTSIGWLLLDFNLFQFSCYLYFNFSNCHWFWYIVLLYRFYTCISTVYRWRWLSWSHPHKLFFLSISFHWVFEN